MLWPQNVLQPSHIQEWACDVISLLILSDIRSLCALVPTFTNTDEQCRLLKCFWDETHSSVNGVFVLGQRKEGEIQRGREQGVTEKGNDRNYYSNSLCRCLEICSPSLLFYLFLHSALPFLPVCCSVTSPCLSPALLLTTVHYLLFISSAYLSSTWTSQFIHSAASHTDLPVRVSHTFIIPSQSCVHSVMQHVN